MISIELLACRRNKEVKTMDQIKIGRYIAGKRKSLEWTQAQLAEKLGVSDKSVSKWERGVCLPDVSLYQDLCEELGISINEFFAGEDINKEEIGTRAEETIMDVARDGSVRRRKLKRAIIALSIVAALLACGTIYAVHFISEKGYFLKNYVAAYDASDSERAMKGILSASGSNTELLKFDVDDTYKSVSIILNKYEKGKLISSESQMEIPFEEAADRKGIVAITTNAETGKCTITEATEVSKVSAEGIELLPKKDIPSHGAYSYSTMYQPASADKGTEIPITAFFMSDDDSAGLEGLPVEDMQARYDETGTTTEYSCLFLLKFE